MGIGKVAAHRRLLVVSYGVCEDEIILAGKLLVLLIEIEEEVTIHRNGGGTGVLDGRRGGCERELVHSRTRAA